MLKIAIFSAVGLLVLFTGFLAYRVIRTVRKLRTPLSTTPGGTGLEPSEKTLALAAKMGGISISEARRRLGVLDTADAATVQKVSKTLKAASSTGAQRTGVTKTDGIPVSEVRRRQEAKGTASKKKKARKTANRSRANNRNK